MKRIIPITFLFLALLGSLGAQDKKSFVKITNSSDSSGSSEFYYVSASDPFTLTCECSPDIASVTINRYSDENRTTLKDGYTLKKFKKGNTRFIYRLFPSLGNLEVGMNHYSLVAVSASGEKITVDFSLMYHTEMAERAKPVIYLYPPKDAKVEVNVRPKEGVSRSIPDIGSGWKVLARPDGRLTNAADSKDYPYLFWESPDRGAPEKIKSGFVVKREDLKAFFAGKLALLGLNEREIADFDAFWLPIMAKHPYYAIRFVDKAKLDADAPLSVKPAPDSVIRVYFESEGLSAPADLPAQDLKPAARSGFSVVEWGGRRTDE